MYRPCKWEVTKKELLDGLDPEGAIEAGFDACLIDLYKRGNYCPCGEDTDSRFVIVPIMEKDVDHIVPPQYFRYRDRL